MGGEASSFPISKLVDVSSPCWRCNADRAFLFAEVSIDECFDIPILQSKVIAFDAFGRIRK